MDTLLNAEEREFAQQMRQFYRTEIPEELRASRSPPARS